jgi:hypothetical protein
MVTPNESLTGLILAPVKAILNRSLIDRASDCELIQGQTTISMLNRRTAGCNSVMFFQPDTQPSLLVKYFITAQLI